MKISGFTIARNVIKYNYPILESIRSILPICDEFIVNVGDSDDGTLDLIKSIHSEKIRIIERQWDMSMGPEVLSYQTNLALEQCQGTWAFYLQSDEVIHQDDLPKLRAIMERYADDKEVDALRFKWLHFFGSFHRYRIDRGWYQKQDRIIRNNGEVVSFGDAFGFKRKDNQPLKRKSTGCLLYHYGWVQPGDVMRHRRVNAGNIGFAEISEHNKLNDYDFGDLNRFPVYFGKHPDVMSSIVEGHDMSREDYEVIKGRYWYHPALWLRFRYKTGRRVKVAIE